MKRLINTRDDRVFFAPLKSIQDGGRLELGAKCDRGVAGAISPEVKISGDTEKELRALPAARAMLEAGHIEIR